MTIPILRRPSRRSNIAATFAALFGALIIGIWIGWFVFADASPPSNSSTGLRDPSWSSEERYGPCIVNRVIDGDTVDVACGEDRTRVRLLNVDTPERGQPGYQAARDALVSLTRDQRIFLIFERPGVPSRGKYGRLLAYLVSESGTNLNLALVTEGWSPFYRKYGDGRFPEAFLQAEADAQRQSLGLWAMR